MIFTCLAILLHLFTISSQSSSDSNMFNLDFIKYYEGINKARMYMVEEDYENAIKWYKLSFLNHSFEFARDGINAAELAAYVQDERQTLYFSIVCVQRGVELAYFESHPDFEFFRASESWTFFTRRYPALRREYLESINQDIRKEIEQMFLEDQAIRKRYYRWYNLLFRSVIAVEWEALNREQVNRILEITEKYGFPGERLIGIDDASIHENLSGDRYSCGLPIVILLHHYSRANPSVSNVLKEAVLSGELFNEHFATISDYEAEYGQGLYENDGYYHVRFNQTKGDTNAIDMKRKKIGLLSQQEMEQFDNIEFLTKFWRYLY